MRAFIAIELPKQLSQELGVFRSQLRKELSSLPLRWPPLENIHLTLKFLGDMSDDRVSAISDALKTQADKAGSFDLHLHGLGVYPSPKKPRVVWVGVTPVDSLMQLQTGIETALAGLGFAPERRPFSPHLTLARVKRSAHGSDLGPLFGALEEDELVQVGAAPAEAAVLFESRLKPTGAEYTPRFSALLGNPQPETHAA